MLKALLPPLTLIFAVTGTILVGWAAPTEAAALGAFGTVIPLIYRKVTLRSLYEACISTIKISSMIMLVLNGGTIYTGVFLGLGGAQVSDNLIQAMHLSPWATLFLFLGLALLAWFILDWISVLLIFVPIFTPIVVKMRFNPIWFSTLFFIMIQTSYLTPPMAPDIFYLKGIPPEIEMNDMFKGVAPYIGLQLIGAALVIMFPQIALWLPDYLMGRGLKLVTGQLKNREGG